jgi:hypothetical protein
MVDDDIDADDAPDVTDVSGARTELLPLLLADIPFRFGGMSATKRETYVARLPQMPHQLIVYKWPGNRDRWDLLLAFKHPSETHLIVLTIEQPKNALDQRVVRLLREQKASPRCLYCRLRADERSGVAYHLSSETL